MKATQVVTSARGMSALLTDIPKVQAHKYSTDYQQQQTRPATAAELKKLAAYYGRKPYA